LANRRRIRWAEVALVDFESVLEYIASNDSVESVVYVHDELMTKIDTLTQYPERCRIAPELKKIGLSEFRELLWKPYRVCFSIHGQEVVVAAVLDGRRDLGQLLVERAFMRGY
jgi:toxin ParE1/3/4